MKFEMRARVIALSATAAATALTSFFVGCSDKESNNEQDKEALTIVNESNVSELTAKKNEAGSRTNADLFRYKAIKANVEKVTEAAEDLEVTLFDTFKIYKQENGKYFVINKEQAYELVETVDGYKIIKEEEKYYVLTDLYGRRVMVFGGEPALNEFSAMLKEKFEAAKADDKVLTVVNGIYVGEPVTTKEVSRYDGSHTYYDFESLMKVCIAGIEDGGYVDPISYEKSEEGDSWIVKRTAYMTDEIGNCIESTEMAIELPIGKTGEVYYDINTNVFTGITFEEDGKTWIGQDTLYNLLGIDVMDGDYTVPGTTDTYKALMVDTAAGVDEPVIVIEPEVQEVETPVEDAPPIEVETVPVPNDPVYEEPVVEDVPPVPEAPAYDQDIYEKLGVQVKLSGTNEQQAQQYYDAVSAAYPSLPWGNNGINVSVDVSSLRSETSVDIWSMTDEEYDRLLNERLAGRDYADIPLEELAKITADFPAATELSAAIETYFNDLTSRDFNAGGYHVAQ